jgi:hypothetical protein
MVMLGCFLSLAALAQEEPRKEEAPKEGPKVVSGSSGDPYSVYANGEYEEVFIDEDFKLYKVRTYQGVVPGRDERAGVSTTVPGSEPSGKKAGVQRIGFEQRELFSRVFIVTTDAVTPWVYDNFVQANATPGVPFQVYVELSGVSIPKTNDRRPLDTKSFATPLLSVEGTEIKTGARIVLTLKREARYLPVQVGNVLYIDVER